MLKLLLIKDDVDPNSKNQNGWTVLWWAAQSKGEAVAKLLLAIKWRRPRP
jgi:ankyrin repeat protein